MCTVYVDFRPAARGHRSGVLRIGERRGSAAAGSDVVQLAGDTFPGGTAPTLVSVAPRVSLHADHTHGSRHAGFTLTSHLSSGVIMVKLQRLTDGHWRDVDTNVPDRNHDAPVRGEAGPPGLLLVRTVVPAEPTRLRGVSRVVTLHVA